MGEDRLADRILRLFGGGSWLGGKSGTHGPLCDDCIATLLDVPQRQQVNQVCRRLSPRQVRRVRGKCSRCVGDKLVNSAAGDEARPTAPLHIPRDPEAGLAVEEMSKRLERFCRSKLQSQPGSRPANLSEMIGSLRSRDVIPERIATMMHTIRKLRNEATHADSPLDDDDKAVARAAWARLRKWAREHHEEL